MPFWESLASGGVSGMLRGAGEFAVKVREAITGESVLSAEQRAEIASQATAMEMFALQADVKTSEQQTSVNLAEAQSPSFFKSGWRPAVGWVCVSGLCYEFLMRPLIPWFINVFKAEPVPAMPQLNFESLLTLLLGMLGLGGLRSWEKFRGVTM